MKKLLVLILLLPVMARAQKDTVLLAHLPTDKDDLISYQTVITVPGISKSDLYHRARVWAALAFNSAKNVTQYDDDAGTNIIIKAISQQFYTYKFFGTTYPIQYYMYFSLHFTFADNKYRVIIDKFSYETIATTDVIPIKQGVNILYKHLSEWNENVKLGNEEFNKLFDWSKRDARRYAEIINNIDSFSKDTINEIKAAMLKSAKGDDF